MKYLAIATGLLFVLLVPAPSKASSNEYALNRILNVAILRIPSAGQSGPSPAARSLLAPYVFDILNNRPDIRPPLWKLVNPLAPVTVSSEISSRYPNLYATDQKVTPNMAPYWELDLSKVGSAASLKQYDLLLIRADAVIAMDINERRILRQYVDQGGTLWIDGSINGTTFDASNIFRVQFAAPSVSGYNQSYHPVANSPYTFTVANLANLGYGYTNSPSITSSAASSSVPDVTLFQTLGNSLVAGDYGSGHVVVDGLGVTDYINAEGQENGSPANQINQTFATAAEPNPSPYDLTNYTSAPTSELEFMVNVLSFAANSSTVGANVRGDGVQAGNIAGALSASWQYLFPASAAAVISPSGVAAFGKFVFTTDTSGSLHCFDVNPGESIFSDAVNGDDGATDFSLGTSYDLIWTAAGMTAPLSAPVVACLPITGVGNIEVVMVEDARGDVNIYPAAVDPGPGGVAPSPLLTLSGTGASFGSYVPGPTYYRGQLLVPQSSGAMNVYTTPLVTTGTNNSSSYSVSAVGNWVQPLAVASVPSTDSIGFNGDEIVGYGVFSSGIQTMELGSRDESLKLPTGMTGTATTYDTHAGEIPSIGADVLVGAPEDTGSNASSMNWILDFNSDNQGNVFDYPAQSAQANAVTVGTLEETLYADFNVVAGTTAPVRTAIIAEDANGSGTNYAIQGAAVGPDNIVYLTVNDGVTNSYIEAVSEQASPNTTSTIVWRFLLDGSYNSTTSSYSLSDASGIGYDFGGFQFIGAPIAGANGVVYALASNGVVSRLMAFNETPTVGFGNPTGQGKIQVTQVDEYGNSETITNYNAGIFTNFSPSSSGSLSPSLFAPGTVVVQGLDQNNAPVGAAIPTNIDTAFNGATPMLEWYTEIPGAPTSAPRKVGDYIYFGLGQTTNAAAVTVPASTVAVLGDPARIGLSATPSTRKIAANSDYRFVQDVPTRLGAVTLPPVGVDKYLVNAGIGGFEGLNYNNVLVADGNRLIELDPSGNATWTMDATQEPSPVGAAVAPNTLGNIVPVTTDSQTSVMLNRPSTVTQLSANDYLIADTGNNRCVHADRSGIVLTKLVDTSGNILTPGIPAESSNVATTPLTFTQINPLEISSFTDPLAILPIGQPLTLNQPNAVVTWLTYEYVNGTAPGALADYINVHYLISDTGNNRILDIVDRYKEYVSSTGQATNQYYLQFASDFHYVDWVSHVTDIAGRAYKYVGAEPLLNTGTLNADSAQYPDGFVPPASDAVINNAVGVIAVVGDENISGLDLTQPSNFPTANQDSSGSSILLLNYSTGFPFNAATKSGLPIQLINSVSYGPAAADHTLPLRGLRSAVATSYTSGSIPSLGSFVIADADGVFDGTYAAGTSTNIQTKPYLMDATYGATSVGWSFLQADYLNIVSQYNIAQSALAPPANGTGYDNYNGTNFVPASAIQLSGNNYLIVNTGGAGNPNSATQSGLADTGFGGNVFTVHASVSNGNAPMNTLDGPIYGRPANTGALSAPSFALRAN